jgi:hypothetical protein
MGRSEESWENGKIGGELAEWEGRRIARGMGRSEEEPCETCFFFFFVFFFFFFFFFFFVQKGKCGNCVAPPTH